MAVKRLLQVRPQYDDSNGALASNYRLFFYAAGSSTKQNTYNSSTGAVANANPIVLNALGEPAVEIWGTVGQTYKIGLSIAGVDDPPASFIWTEDNVSVINDATVTLDQWISGPAPTYVSATSFTLVGDQTSTFHVGRRLKTTNSGGTIYSTITASAFGAVTTITVANDSGTLDSGLSAVSYSLTSAVNTSIDADMVNRKGTAVASAATTDIWSIAGDYVHVTGSTGPITSFGTAPYAGAQRIVIFDSTPTITHNATSLSLPGGANIVAVANDRMVVRADTTANMMVVDYIRASGVFVLGTEQLTTSGTSIDFTGIPPSAKRIIIQLVGVSTSGISPILFQLGDSGGIETSGYLASAARIATANVTEAGSSTAGFPLVAMAATGVFHGQITLTLENSTTFTWVCSGVGAKTDVVEIMMVGGRKSTSAALDRVRITTANGTDTFDAGAINILYE